MMDLKVSDIGFAKTKNLSKVERNHLGVTPKAQESNFQSLHQIPYIVLSNFQYFNHKGLF